MADPYTRVSCFRKWSCTRLQVGDELLCTLAGGELRRRSQGFRIMDALGPTASQMKLIGMYDGKIFRAPFMRQIEKTYLIKKLAAVHHVSISF